MKINIDLDITPDEVRKLFGLPDVEGFQRQMMEEMGRRLAAGAEGFDALQLYKPYLAGTQASWDLFQRFLAAATPSSSGSRTSAERES